MLRQAGQKRFNNTNMIVIVNSAVIFLKYSINKVWKIVKNAQHTGLEMITNLWKLLH